MSCLGLVDSFAMTIVTAPRVTLFNGQRAYVIVAEEKPYVSGIAVVRTADGASLFYQKVGRGRSVPLSMSQRRAVLSLLAVASCRPSGLKSAFHM